MESHDPPWGVREAARRCKLSPTQISTFLNTKLKRFPRTETILKISSGLKIPQYDLVAAALKSLGIPRDPSESQNDYDKIMSLSLHSKREKEALYAQLEYLLDKQARRSGER